MIEIRMNEKAQHTTKIHLHDDLTFQWLRQVKPNDFRSKKWFAILWV